jgi:hypothetical protein
MSRGEVLCNTCIVVARLQPSKEVGMLLDEGTYDLSLR